MIVNGISRSDVIKSFIHFDILNREFIDYVGNYWFDVDSLLGPELNKEITDSLKKFRDFDLSKDFVHYNNGNFIYFVVCENETKSLVLGYDIYPILTLFVNSEYEKKFEDKMLRFKEYLEEMALDIGYPYIRLHDERYRKLYFESTKEHPVVKNVSANLELHKKEDGGITEYTVNNHETKESFHHSKFVQHSKSELPFDHIEQSEVQRVKSNVLPRNFAVDLAYQHFSNQNSPLRSSEQQYKDGHRMWHKLVDRALHEGHHVYHWDGEHLHETTQSNKEEHLENSFGTNFTFENKHMIISKKLI